MNLFLNFPLIRVSAALNMIVVVDQSRMKLTTLHPNDRLSHLFHTVLWAEWRPASAEEPASYAALTPSKADSQICTWSSVRSLLWTASRGPPNLSKSYLGERGCKTGTIGYWSKSKKLCIFSVFSVFPSLSGLTGTSMADGQRRHMSSHLGDVENFRFLETEIQRLKPIH